MMFKIIKALILIHLCISFCKTQETGEKLKGTPISSDPNSETLKFAFDDDFTSEFKSKLGTNSWVGLDLSSSFRITKIGWAQKMGDKSNYLLGVFEGANDPSFIDAIPLFMITEEGKSEEMNYVSIDVTNKFRYVRYIGPNKKYSVLSGFEVYGIEEEDKKEKLYQPTKLPLIVIHTEDSKEPPREKTEVNCNIVMINNGKTEKTSSGTIKLRGNSTLNLDKKSFSIKFSQKEKILNFSAKSKKWNLLANHMDKTLMRNLLAFKVGSLFDMKFVPECISVDLMFNGEYKGNYILCDKIEVDDNRIDITKTDKTCIEEPEISGGYLLEAGGGGWGWGGSQPKKGRTTKGIDYVISYPDEEDITSEQSDYIKKRFNLIEEEVYNNEVKNIDVDSFLKVLLTQEFCGNIDSVHGNYYITKERGDDKFHFGPVWDFDLSLDNDGRLYPTNQKEKFVYKYGDSAGTLRDFVIKILSNENVLKALKDKWKELVNTKSITEVLLDFIDEQKSLIIESQKLNFIRWDILNKKVMFDIQGKGSFEAEIDSLKEFISGRVESLGKIIESSTVTNVAEGIEKRGGGWGGWDGGNWGGDWGNRGGNWTRPGRNDQ